MKRKLFIFAVGGTGARVLRSFTMLLASGLEGFESSNTEIVPIIIDHDRQCGDKNRAVDALNKYQEIRTELYQDETVAYNENFFMTPLTPLMDLGAIAHPNYGNDGRWCLDFGPTGNISYANYIGLDDIQHTNGMESTAGLLHALYDSSPESASQAELYENLNVGFKGKPNIGSVVFNELKDNTQFQHFLGKCSGSDDKVIIIGSLFGGTGSSGIPEIAKAIKDSGKACNNVKIAAVLMLPYFKLGTNNHAADGLNTGAIRHELFNAKTRIALDTYGKGSPNSINEHYFNTVYYVGDEVNHTAHTYNEGSVEQKNPAHVAEFVAAQAIINFWKDNSESGAYEFGILNDGQDNGSIKLPDFYQQTHDQSLNSLSAFVIAMRYYREVVCGDSAGRKISATTSFYSNQGYDLSNRLGKDVYQMVDTFLGGFGNQTNDWGFYPWLRDLESQKHSLKLYNIETSSIHDVLSHKTIKREWTFKGKQSPVDDNVLSSELDKITEHVTPKNAMTFFKALRILGQMTYNKIK